jgi:DNA (cytosine-5)-methyltransferase 1
MKFIELFAGIGGFRLGLEKAGHQCVWSNEIVDKARSIYEYNFKDAPDGRDIRTIQPDEIPNCDLLVGGFPCATFSVAGRRTGFSTEDTRGTLFFEICRFLRSKRIPYVFLENVKGLLNHDEGRTFGVIIASLDELGYDIQWECVNSKNFGVPQNRERIFIIGHLRGHPRPQVFPIGKCSATYDESSKSKQGKEQRILEPYLPTLDAHYNQVGGGGRAYIDESGVNAESTDGAVRAVNYAFKELRVSDTVSTLKCSHTPMVLQEPKDDEFIQSVNYTRKEFRISDTHTPTLTDRMGTGGNNVPYINKVRAVLTPDREEKRQNGRQIKEDGEPSFTLTAQDRHGVIVGSTLRKLTPLECERLQGLPDNWTKWYKDGSLVPDSQRYERCGRAVTVNVIEQIARRFPV